MTSRVAGLAATAITLTLFAAQASAAAQRTFVSTGGVANPACSLAAPCRAFSDALAATLPGGEVIVLDSGGYGGGTITQAVSIVAPPGVYAGITVFGGDGVTINAGASDVVKLRGLTLNGLGGVNGIKVNTVGLLQVDDVRASGFSLYGLNFAADGRLVVTNSVFENNGGTGLVAKAASGVARVAIDQSRFDHNVSNGVVIGANAAGSIARSTASHNPSVGFLIDEGAIATVAECKVMDRYEPVVTSYGILVRGAGTRAMISRCDVFGSFYGYAVILGATAQIVDSSAQSGNIGFSVQAAELYAERSTATNTQTGFATKYVGAKLRVSSCTSTRNDVGIFVDIGSTVETRGNNTVRGNASFEVFNVGTFTTIGGV